jgi:hypothetical protein
MNKERRIQKKGFRCSTCYSAFFGSKKDIGKTIRCRNASVPPCHTGYGLGLDINCVACDKWKPRTSRQKENLALIK